MVKALIQATKMSTILVEFDTLKGPVIRKRTPKSFEMLKKLEIESILLWIIRADEFSVRKIESDTAYAKTFTLSDPNFARKKRRFGLALISKDTIELTSAEKIINELLNKCREVGENQPYFKMLNNLFQILNQTMEIDSSSEVNKQTETNSKHANNSETKKEHILLMSKRLSIFNKLSIIDKKKKEQITVSSTDNFGKADRNIGSVHKLQSEKFEIIADLRLEIPETLMLGLELLLRIIDVLPIGIVLKDRFLVAAEYIDRLLYEEVDIEYYLPFLQYFVSMENFTITEFNTEEFSLRIDEFQENYGEWVKELQKKNLDGKKLTKYFQIVGQRREGLELLIDLLFVKLISLF